MRRKVTIVGAGHVGATTAQRVAERQLADVILMDIIEGLPQGKGLDLLESGPIEGFDTRVVGTNDYDTTKDSDIAVIVAGLPRQPGMSRDELLEKNTRIVRDVTANLAARSPNAILIVVTNPLDAMVYTAYKVSGFPKERVIGMAGILDSTRFRTFIAQELHVSVENTHAFVLGGHGDTMVPLPRYSTVAGVPLTDLLDEGTIQSLVKRTRGGGGEIVELLKAGSAYYAPSSAITEMIDAILNDRRKVLPCSAYCEGEYGADDIFLGVPVVLGRHGVEKIFEIELTPEEQKQLQRSIDHVKILVAKIPL